MPFVTDYDLAPSSLVGHVGSRIRGLNRLLGLLAPIPAEWLDGARRGPSGTQPDSGGKLTATHCNTYSTLIDTWKKAMYWTEGLDRALSIMLASICSVKGTGEQLWIKVLGPAACGKSTLCEAVSISTKHVAAKSVIRGFHSGYRESDSKQDNSLISQIRDKSLVTKDGDTLLRSPNLPQILAEGRDLFDGTSRTHYRNAMGKDYSEVKMTWILCGTASLHNLDNSELGERFLSCVIMDKIDSALEDEILKSVAMRANRSFGVSGSSGGTYEPEIAAAMSLTGGYVNWICENVSMLEPQVYLSGEEQDQCISLGKFVAFMRAQPSEHQNKVAERELATRLVSQLIRLAKHLAVVLNKNNVDAEVMRRVTRTSIDTARGTTLAASSHLYSAATTGLETRSLSMLLGEGDETLRKQLRFMRAIGIVETFIPDESKRPRWRLTPMVYQIYTEAMKHFKVV